MRRKNLLVITTDQHRGDSFGFEGCIVKTPHLDELAYAGTRFSNCNCGSIECSMSLLPRVRPVSEVAVQRFRCMLTRFSAR